MVGMKLTKKIPWGFLVTIVAIFFGIVNFVCFFYSIIYNDTYWQLYSGVTVFGEFCEGAVGVQENNWKAEEEFNKPHVFSPQGLPFLKYPLTAPRKISIGQFWINRCKIDLSQLGKSDDYSVNLGIVTGTVVVFVGNRKALVQGDGENAEFRLWPDEKTRGLVITIIGSNNQESAVIVGPTTSRPLYIADSRQLVAGIQNHWQTPGQSDFSLLSIMTSLVLLCLFSGVWIFGIRYPDITWLIVLLSANAACLTLGYIRPMPTEGIEINLRIILSSISLYGFLGFVFAYLRIEFAKNHVAWIIGGIVSTNFLIGAILPTSAFEFTGVLRFLVLGLPFVGAVVIAILASLTLSKVHGARKAKFVFFAIAVIVAQGTFLLSLIFPEAPLSLFSRNILLILMILASWLMIAELTVFQRQYLVERQDTAALEHEKLQLTDTMLLGRTVQNLLFPKKRADMINNVRFQFFHEAASALSGDWFYHWTSPRGCLNFIVGDVVGKGPGAAIAVATIFAFLKSSRREDEELEDCLGNLNQTLLDLFAGHMNTTVMALSISPDQKIESWNCGGAGWFSLINSSVQSHRQQTAPMGRNHEVHWDKRSWQAKPGEIILSFTDGLLDGARGVHQLNELCAEFSENPLNFQDVYVFVKHIGVESNLHAEGTMLVLQIAA
jgi:hypothetical protein